MKARFIRIDNNAMTDEFQMNTNQFHTGDIIDLTCWIVEDHYNEQAKDYEKIRKAHTNFYGLFTVVGIRHEVTVEEIVSTYFKHNAINILIKPC